MNKYHNPYHEFLIDEVSGTEVRDIRYRIWDEGYEAGTNGARTPDSTPPVSGDNRAQ